MKHKKPTPITRAFAFSNARWGITQVEFTPVEDSLHEARVLCDGGASTPAAPLWLRVLQKENSYYFGILRNDRSDQDCLSSSETHNILRFRPDSALHKFDEKRNLFGPFNEADAEDFIQLADNAACRMHLAVKDKEREALSLNNLTNPLT